MQLWTIYIQDIQNALYIDYNIPGNTRRCYKIRTKYNRTVSDFSPSKCATAIKADISRPTDLVAIAFDDRIELSWKDNSTNEDGFHIYHSYDGLNFSILSSTGNPRNMILSMISLENTSISLKLVGLSSITARVMFSTCWT